MTIEIKRFVAGPLENNVYVAHDGATALVIDPALECDEVVAFLLERKLICTAIVLTHGHFDHILGIPLILEHFPNIPVYIHNDDKPMLTDGFLNGASMIGMSYVFTGTTKVLAEGSMQIGAFSFTVIPVPGHTHGGSALLFGNDLLSGDILFAGSVGRSDLPGGNGAQLIDGIQKKIMTLDDSVVVWSGHGGRTTIGRERKHNPYLPA